MAFGDGDFEGGGVAGEGDVEGGGVVAVLVGYKWVAYLLFRFLTWLGCMAKPESALLIYRCWVRDWASKVRRMSVMLPFCIGSF